MCHPFELEEYGIEELCECVKGVGYVLKQGKLYTYKPMQTLPGMATVC